MTKLLNFKNQGLTKFPKEVRGMRELTNLNLMDNKIRRIPDWISELKNLKVLYLSGNEISDITGLSALQDLEVLNLSNNKIASLPASIGKLKKLKRLFISDNLLNDLGDHLEELSELNMLLVANNRLTTLNEHIGQLRKLTVLNVFNNQLRTLPESIVNLAQIEYLQVSKNKLTTLPASIGKLKRMTSFEVFSNKLTELHDGLKDLESLLSFNIGNNRIREISNIPESVKCLSVYKNPLEKIDSKIIQKFQNELPGDGYLFVDKAQADAFGLEKKDFGAQLKIVDFKSGKIKRLDFKYIPLELQSDFDLKPDRENL